MGQFKPLLPFGRSTVIESVIDSLRAADIGDITVVLGHRATELQSLLEGLHVHCVLNPAYDQGMYSSVVAGFRSLPGEIDAGLLLPGDMPGVQPNTIRLMIEDFAVHQAPITYPVLAGRRGHPPLISRLLFPAILQADGAGGLRGVLAGHDSSARELVVRDEGIHLDLDTPQQYREVCARFAGNGSVPAGIPASSNPIGKDKTS